MHRVDAHEGISWRAILLVWALERVLIGRVNRVLVLAWSRTHLSKDCNSHVRIWIPALNSCAGMLIPAIKLLCWHAHSSHGPIPFVQTGIPKWDPISTAVRILDYKKRRPYLQPFLPYNFLRHLHYMPWHFLHTPLEHSPLPGSSEYNFECKPATVNSSHYARIWHTLYLKRRTSSPDFICEIRSGAGLVLQQGIEFPSALP